VQPSRRRTPKFPLIEIGRARRKEDALAGLERWRSRHAEAASHLEPADVLVDAMRGRFHTWTRVRLNLQHVPEALRPAQAALDPDDGDDGGYGGNGSQKRSNGENGGTGKRKR
jgi:bifunctional non-homologous end joining protein LigD